MHIVIQNCEVSMFCVEIRNRNIRLMWIEKAGEYLVVRSPDSRSFKNGCISTEPRLAVVDNPCHFLLLSLLILTRPLHICLGTSLLARPRVHASCSRSADQITWTQLLWWLLACLGAWVWMNKTGFVSPPVRCSQATLLALQYFYVYKIFYIF